MAKKKWLILLAFLLVIQLFRPERANPQAPPDLSLAAVSRPPAEVHRLLKSACFACHSNQTVWPWYSNIAPFSWLIADDVRRGRQHMNFSDWARYDLVEKAHHFEEMPKLVRAGDMPPWDYRLAHPQSRLSDAQVAAIANWAEQERRKLHPPR